MNISACASCHAKGVCTASDMQDKIVEVTDDLQKYTVGEEVKVALQQSLGFKALFYGYVLPFCIVLVALFGFSALTNNEAVVGIASLGILVPYYLVLHQVKDRFAKVFTFTIEKLT